MAPTSKIALDGRSNRVITIPRMDEKKLKAALEDAAALLRLLDGVLSGKIDGELITYMESAAAHPWMLEKLLSELPAQKARLTKGVA